MSFRFKTGRFNKGQALIGNPGGTDLLVNLI